MSWCAFCHWLIWRSKGRPVQKFKHGYWIWSRLIKVLMIVLTEYNGIPVVWPTLWMENWKETERGVFEESNPSALNLLRWAAECVVLAKENHKYYFLHWVYNNEVQCYMLVVWINPLLTHLNTFNTHLHRIHKSWKNRYAERASRPNCCRSSCIKYSTCKHPARNKISRRITNIILYKNTIY